MMGKKDTPAIKESILKFAQQQKIELQELRHKHKMEELEKELEIVRLMGKLGITRK